MRSRLLRIREKQRDERRVRVLRGTAFSCCPRSLAASCLELIANRQRTDTLPVAAKIALHGAVYPAPPGRSHNESKVVVSRRKHVRRTLASIRRSLPS